MAGRIRQGQHDVDSSIVFGALLAFRLVNSQLVQTFFQPDEYFQALEPAWEIAFGPQSGAWLTWEWREQLRTSVHPFLFAAIYRALDWICELLQANFRTRAALLGAGPRLLQAFWAAALDLLTWRLASKVYGSRNAACRAALTISVLSPWQWFCSTRTFSNSLETTLTALSLCYFPWEYFLHHVGQENSLQKHKGERGSGDDDTSGLYPALFAAAAAFYFRPTNIIIWIAISAMIVVQTRSLHKAAALISGAVVAGLTTVLAFAGADRLYYGEWVIPPLRFLYVNVVQSLAVFYGRNRPDYYLTEGLPLLLTTLLPFAMVGLWKSLASGFSAGIAQHRLENSVKTVFAIAILMTVATLSLIDHKEMRFIYPLLPMLHVLAAQPAASFFVARNKMRIALLAVAIGANLFIAYYVGFVHQRGVIDVMHFLREKQEAWADADITNNLMRGTSPNVTVGFLMPCHSTPWRSHLIYPQIDAWALTCEPPVNISPDQRAAYLDEADIFYDDPASWLNDNMDGLDNISLDAPIQEGFSRPEVDGRRAWPHYLVSFEQLEPALAAFLDGTRYQQCQRFFNTHWIDDSRRRGDVVVWCMRRS